MDVRSAFHSGLEGFKNATTQVSESAHKIANATTPVEVVDKPETEEAQRLAAPRSEVSITTELVNMKVAELQAKASAKVITTADEVMGSIIDVRV